MSTLYKHKQITDVTYELVESTKSHVYLKESGTGREAIVNRVEFEKHYEKIK